MLPQASLRTAPIVHSFPNSARPLAPASGGFGRIEAMASPMTFGPNEEIFGEDEPAEYAYKVIKGVVRTYKDTQRWPPPNRRLLPTG